MSSSPATPATAGVSASMWANAPNSPRAGWGRAGEREPGSAFRGMGKSRAGGGRGGASNRGGRGGRGSGGRGGTPSRAEGSVSKSTNDQSKEKPAKPSETQKTVSAPSQPISATPKPSTLPPISTNHPPSSSKAQNNRPKKSNEQQKAPARKGSVNSDAASVAATNSPTNSTSSRSSRRKRSHTNNKPPPALPSAPSRKPSVSIGTNINRTRHGRQPSSAVKDLPPHLAPPPTSDTPSFDIKHNIDALVERVRAVAMDRPNTPGSHIDWAGDDDDSLPDLDDWGVTSSVSAPGKSSVISPILEGSLKPLPSIEANLSPELAETDVGNVHKLREASPASEPTNIASAAVEVVVTPPVGQDTTEATSKISGSQEKPSSQELTEVHDSDVPLKTDMNSSHPPQPSTHDPDAPPSIEIPVQSGLAQSIHAPSNDGVLISSKDTSPERSLSPPSTHATPNFRSAPPHITGHNVPRTSRGGGFKPTHNRAHTVGKPPSYRLPHSASSGSFPDQVSDIDRPRRGDNPQHARTHSSPPVAASHRAHASRPVITMDAMAKLARTLNGTPLSKRDSTPAAATAKE
ncbi:hypothetical protein ABKN59_000380 [Abortiporus biennis]